ncbi:auxin efflux carrier [Tanacetum coccineum]
MLLEASDWSEGSNTTSTTPIFEKIDKVKRLIIDGKEAFVDDDGKPLENVDYASDHDSDNESAGTIEETYENVDYDYDPYDEDLYEGQELPNNIQSICNNLDIKVREVSADNELLDSLVIAIPIDKDNGHTLATIDVEYEWNPPRCATCKIFDHHSEICPKLVKDQPVVNDADEGFVEVKKKKHKNKNKQHKVAGVRLTKPQPQLLYRRVDRGETSQKVHTDKAPIVTQAPEFIVKNSFGPLDENEGDGFHDESLKHDDVLNVSDSEVDEEFQVDRNGNVSSNRTGASTPANEVSNVCLIIGIGLRMARGVTKELGLFMGWNRNDVDGCHLSNEQVIHTPYLVEDGEKGSETSNFNYANLFNVRINDQDAQDMVREISDQEVKDAIFSIGDDKSPGPDGFTAAFFKEAWKYANDVLCVRSLLTIFADDLFLFALWDVGFTSIIKEALDEFKNASGLVPSLPKSTAYFCNVLNHVKLSILQILPFEEGKLPVKYLGVPLVSSRLMIRDCNELVDKVQLRIQDWKNKSLSIAGRLQLIHSILGSMHIYWASVFILPTRVLLNIEQLMRQFLWCHGSSGKGKSKVAWEIVCLPKHEGGLGIRRLECFNSALMASHIWKLLTLKESLWVKWIHEYKLKGRNFWDFPMRGNMSWGWRKILKLRPIIWNFIWSKIGNGRNTSLWFDTWADFEPRAAQISPRDIVRSGLSLQSKVQDVIHHGLWALMPIMKRRTTNSVVAKLVVAAATYYVWQERNWRLFKKGKRSPDQIVECIKSSVRLKLLSCKLKKSKNGERLARLWDLPEARLCKLWLAVNVTLSLRVGCWLECELLNRAWFLESKREWGWRGVKDKDNVVMLGYGIISVIDEPVVKKKQSSLVDRSIPNVEKQKGFDFLTLFNLGGNGVEYFVSWSLLELYSEGCEYASGFFGKGGVINLSMDGLNAMLENGSWFIPNHPLILKKWNPDVNLLKKDVGNIPGRSSYSRAIIELRADVELKDTIVVAMPKLNREGRNCHKDSDLACGDRLKKHGSYLAIKVLLGTIGDFTYGNGDYDEDPYDDDMYEGQDFPDKIQDICDNLDIRVRDSFVQLVVSDFDEWASGSGYFTFSRVADIGTSDLKISFQKMNHGDGADFDGPLGTLAHARLHFDVDETWSLGPGPVPNVIDFKSVALHEIGHLLGLNHSQYQDAVMWESLPLGTVKDKLTSDDIQGIKVLYGLTRFKDMK